MVMRYSFKVAPGVKVRISPRSVGLGVGPRAGRFHVSSSGYTGVSSGVGQFQSYHPLSRGGRRGSGGGGSSGGQRMTARQQRAAQHRDRAEHLAGLLGVADDRFVVASPPRVPPPPPVVPARVEGELVEAALDGIPWYRLGDRRAAKARARDRVGGEVQRRQQAAADAHRRRAEDAAAWWERLLANDPDVVMPALDEAMADNRLEAVTVDVSDGRASLLVPVPDAPTLIGEREPSTTDAGNPTTKKLSQTRRNELYLGALLASAAAAVTESVAVAPALSHVSVVAARTGSDEDGPVLALEADADRLWPPATRQAGTELKLDLDDLAAGEELGIVRTDVERRGRTRELATLDDPELVDLVASTATAEEDVPLDVPAAPGQVVLDEVGAHAVDVVAVLRQHVGLDLAEAAARVDRALPSVVAEGLDVAAARALVDALERAGGRAHTG